MGTLICCGTGKGVVIATGENSEFGAVFRMMKSEEAPRTPLQRSMDKLGKQLSFFSLVIISSIVVVGLFQGRHLLELLNISVSLAVAAIPEGLPIVVTVTLAIGQMRMAARNAIVRKLPAVETLGCVDIVCADKTGTMTKNEMTVAQLVSSNLERFAVIQHHHASSNTPVKLHLISEDHKTDYNPLLLETDISNSPLRCISSSQLAPDSYDSKVQRMIEIACLCNNAVLKVGEINGQPTEGALLRLACQLRISDLRPLYQRLREYPFSSETKMMMVNCKRNGQSLDAGSVYFAKGSVDRILAQCAYYETYNEMAFGKCTDSPRSDDSDASPVLYGSRHSLLSPSYAKEVMREAAQLGSLGLRVLAFAEGTDPNQLVFHGLVGLLDPPRAGVDRCVLTLLTSGVRVVMITGDSKETACAIGSRLALYRHGDQCMSGEEIEQTNLKVFESLVQHVKIFYRSGPRHKCKIVKALQRCGHVVAMTGDGVNDAVALKSSDIGIAMGRGGTDVCREASDIVLLDDNFSTILAAMEEGKAIFHNIRNFVGFQLSTSIAALSIIALSTVFSLPNPLNAMQILYINILMDGPPAQSLGVEPPDKDVVRQPPRPVRDSILDGRLMVNVFIAASTIVFGTFWIFYNEMSDGHVTPRDTTMTFTCFVFFDMFNALGFRSQKKSIFQLGFSTNRMFLMAVGLSILGQILVIYLPPLQSIFQTEALAPRDLLLLLCLTSSVFFISELRKLIRSDCLYTLTNGFVCCSRRRIFTKFDESMV